MDRGRFLFALVLAAVMIVATAGDVSPTVPSARAASAGLVCGTTDDPTPTPTPETPTASPEPSLTPSPTDTPPPGVTPSVTPTASRTPTVTASPSPSPTTCTRTPVEVVLVIDASTSMREFTSGGRTKLAAALDAASDLIGMLDYSRGDAAAIVGFNFETWTQLMSSSEPELLAALGRIPGHMAQGTRLDLAVNAGGLAHGLYPARLGDAREVVILLTDGEPNQVPFGPGSAFPTCPDQECSVAKIADLVRRQGAGIEIIAVGLGSEVLERLMVRIADDPSRYYYAPDGEGLIPIYRQIAAGLVRCGGEFIELPRNSHGTEPQAPAWYVKTVELASTKAGERIIVAGASEADARRIALYNRGHLVEDPLLEGAGYRLIWTPGRDEAQLDERTIDLQAGADVWREEVGELLAEPWPSDPRFGDQWGLHDMWGMNWLDAWSDLLRFGDAARGLIVAVIDNGTECPHPDMNCHVGTHFDATTADELIHRSHSDTEIRVRGTGYDHGTFVAALAGARVNNGYGVAGTSQASILNVQGCIGGGCAESDVIRAQAWLASRLDAGLPVVAVNMSFAFKTSRLCPGSDALRSRGAMPVAAVGNSGDRTTGGRPQYPAACGSVVGVAHMQRDGTKDPQAQRAAVDLVTAGSDVPSLCAVPHTTGTGSGSSFAAPRVAAGIAMIAAALPDIGAGRPQVIEEALRILYDTAVPLPGASHPQGTRDDAYDGYGRMDLRAAMNAVSDVWTDAGVPTPTTTPAATPTPEGTATPTPCADSKERCAAYKTATAIARGTDTPAPPPTGTPLDPTIAAALTGTPTYTPTPEPSVEPTVAAELTAIAGSATPNRATVAAILTEIAPTGTPDVLATVTHLRCFVFRECYNIFIPRARK